MRLEANNPKGSICLSTTISRLLATTRQLLTMFKAGIARDDNTSYSKAGKPDFSNAQSIPIT